MHLPASHASSKLATAQLTTTHIVDLRACVPPDVKQLGDIITKVRKLDDGSYMRKLLQSTSEEVRCRCNCRLSCAWLAHLVHTSCNATHYLDG